KAAALAARLPGRHGDRVRRLRSHEDARLERARYPDCDRAGTDLRGDESTGRRRHRASHQAARNSPDVRASRQYGLRLRDVSRCPGRAPAGRPGIARVPLCRLAARGSAPVSDSPAASPPILEPTATLQARSLRFLLAPIGSVLDDPTVSEVMVNGPRDIRVEREGRIVQTSLAFGSEDDLV